MYRRSIVWLRRDLRLRDNVALAQAAHQSESLVIAFNLDPELLRSPRVGAPIVQSFFGALAALRGELQEAGSDLVLLQGDFGKQLTRLARDVDAQAVFYNEDYEAAARKRDAHVERELRAHGIDAHASLDHVYFGADEIATDSGTPYKVFSPYKRRWLDQHRLAPRGVVESWRRAKPLLVPARELPTSHDVPEPEAFGHQSSERFPSTSEREARQRLRRFLDDAAQRYGEDRDRPALDGTSRLSPDLRAGTIGIRTCVEAAFRRVHELRGTARSNVETWISELIWRDFYQMILARFPHVEDGAFIESANDIAWEDDRLFERWASGTTGYPIVDAAMRQLNETGWMHNRLRMIVASFLTKDLLISWQRGERYFEQRLADADVAQNNGGWQWAASTGADPVPYFRVFNPILQSKKFDPDGTFIRRFVPELAKVPSRYIHAPWTIPPLEAASVGFELGKTYPEPIVEHDAARARALEAYASVLRNKQRG